MPMTSAERKKKYLEKLKSNGVYEAFKKEKAASEKLRRDRIKSGLEKLPKAVREKTKRLNLSYKRKKAAEYRMRKKSLPPNAVSTISSPQSALSTNAPDALSTNASNALSTNEPNALSANALNALSTNAPNALSANAPNAMPTNAPDALSTNASNALSTNASNALSTNASNALSTNASNALPTNALPTIALPTNTLSTNALSTNAMSTSALSTHALSTNASPATQVDGYKTKSALDKAVAKIKRAVPSASAKKKQAICKFLKTFNADDLQEIMSVVGGKAVNSKSKTTRAISGDVVNSVKAFYERDDISRMSANMRDCRQFMDPETGISEAKQIRHLMYRLTDVYDMFVKHIQNGDKTVKPPLQRSKFYQLRPDYVKLMGSTPLASCFCLYHSNFIMCCDAMNRYLPDFPKYGKILEQTILCDSPKKDCWWQDCQHCSGKIDKKINEFVGRSKNKLRVRVVWSQWMKCPETNRFQKINVSGTLADLRKRFLEILPEFLKHSYIKRSQEATFQSDCDEAGQSNGRVVVVQIDFAESYTCQAQDEIQSAHWNQANV